jgi:hypothetical protein
MFDKDDAQIGLLVFALYRLTLLWVVFQIDPIFTPRYTVLVTYGPSVLLLFALFGADQSWCLLDPRFVGNGRLKHMVKGVNAISAI